MPRAPADNVEKSSQRRLTHRANENFSTRIRVHQYFLSDLAIGSKYFFKDQQSAKRTPPFQYNAGFCHIVFTPSVLSNFSLYETASTITDATR
jgi:hypothetical protein